MTLARMRRGTIPDRVGVLEDRADGHDKVISTLAPTAEQVKEMYEAWSKVKTINWFVVKVGALSGGALGAVAVLLTIWEKLAHIAGH